MNQKSSPVHCRLCEKTIESGDRCGYIADGKNGYGWRCGDCIDDAVKQAAKKYSLFIGRFQPFHEGHQTFIQTLLDEGRKVLVGIRDTPRDKDNPYDAEQVLEMINTVFPNVKTIVLPDIEEVVYGRKIGYDIRKLELGAEVEAISASDIRNQSKEE